jgi:hypothetical protein
MERRGFLVAGGSLLLILPAGWLVAGCENNNGTPDSGVIPADAGFDGRFDGSVTAVLLRFTSSVSAGHTHDFSISVGELVSPPAGGLTGNTTVAQAHVHQVTLSQAELGQIENGQTVTKDTTVVASHLHTFTFNRTLSDASID